MAILDLFLLPGCIHRQVVYSGYAVGSTAIIHEKVGQILDRKERRRYFLFYDVPGFCFCSFCRISEGGYVIDISTTKGNYYAVNRDPNALEILHDLIELKERILEEEKQEEQPYKKYCWRTFEWEWEFKEKWKIETYDCFGFPITRAEIESYRDYRAPYMGAMGCLVFGAPLGAVLGLVAAKGSPDYDESNPGAGWIIFVSAVGLSTIGGITGGNTLAEMKIIDAIREARKPRRIE
jgi:hypothetical protein